jgi:hypothetical protein
VYTDFLFAVNFVDFFKSSASEAEPPSCLRGKYVFLLTAVAERLNPLAFRTWLTPQIAERRTLVPLRIRLRLKLDKFPPRRITLSKPQTLPRRQLPSFASEANAYFYLLLWRNGLIRLGFGHGPRFKSSRVFMTMTKNSSCRVCPVISGNEGKTSLCINACIR